MVASSENEPAEVVSTGTLLIRGKEIPVVTEEVEQSKLRFFAENPRVYSVVRSDSTEPTQEQIQKHLLDMEHVKELIQDIRLNEGLIEPLVVKDGSFEVLEGNSRLAAYRHLAKSEPIKWGKVKCTLLPADISEALVFALLGQYHVKGKKDWVPYEQAGFLYRRFRRHHVDIPTLAREIGISQKQVKHLIDTYQFMVDHNEVDTERWSYYDEYLKSSKIRKVRQQYLTLDSLVVAKIKSREIPRAVDVREQLPIICTSAKTLKKFVNGSMTFEDAYEAALDAGGGSRHLQKVSSFRKWLTREETEKALGSSAGQVRAKLAYELSKLHARIEALRKKIQ
jgi:ParB/Sulfiredoxin domain